MIPSIDSFSFKKQRKKISNAVLGDGSLYGGQSFISKVVKSSANVTSVISAIDNMEMYRFFHFNVSGSERTYNFHSIAHVKPLAVSSIQIRFSIVPFQ